MKIFPKFPKHNGYVDLLLIHTLIYRYAYIWSGVCENCLIALGQFIPPQSKTEIIFHVYIDVGFNA